MNNGIYQEALRLLGLGCSVIPIKIVNSQKNPAIKWKPYQLRHPNEAELRKWFLNNNDWQLALITGCVSRRFILDFDGNGWIEPFNEFMQRFPEFLDGASIQSGKGAHIHGYCDDLPVDITKLVKGYPNAHVELRVNRHYTLVPPSRHPSGRFYTYSESGNIPTSVTRERFMEIVEWIREGQGERITPPTDEETEDIIPLKIPDEWKMKLSDWYRRRMVNQVNIDHALRNDKGYELAMYLLDLRFTREDAREVMEKYASEVRQFPDREPYCVDEALNSLNSAYDNNVPGIPFIPYSMREEMENGEEQEQEEQEHNEQKKQETGKYKDISKALRNVDDFLKIEFPKRKVIISPWLKEQSITLISGWRGSGKTFLSLTLALYAVDGLDYRLSKWFLENPVATLYIDAEMVGDDIQKRYNKLTTDAINKEKLIIYSDHDAHLQGLPPARLGNPEWRGAIKDLILENKIRLVFFDNISALCPDIDENLKHLWGPINAWLLELRYAGVASVLVHHTGKKGDQRGISGREDSIDNSILLAKPADYSDKDGCKFNLHFTKCRGVNDADRNLIPDTEFWLKDEDEYRSVWECGTVSRKNFVECVHMLSSDMKQTEIAKELGVGKSMVTKYLQQAQLKGYLSPNKKLTESGRTLVKTLPEYNNNWQEIDDREEGEQGEK